MTDTEDPGYTDSGVPTFKSVRDKIEERAGTAQGAAELDAESARGRALDAQSAEQQRLARERVEQIRATMRDSGNQK